LTRARFTRSVRKETVLSLGEAIALYVFSSRERAS
jgi:hypothetical protein